MKTIITTLSLLSLSLSSFANSSMDLHGFTVAGKAINPACINLTSTLLSDNGIITRSIIPSNCQNSNQAFTGSNAKQDAKGAICYKQKQQNFCYRVIGKTQNGLFVITTWSWSDDGHGVFSDWRAYRYQQEPDYNYAITNKTWPKIIKKQRILTLLISQVAGDLNSNPQSLKNFHLKGNTLFATQTNKTVHWDLP